MSVQVVSSNNGGNGRQQNVTTQLRQVLNTIPLEGEAWIANRLEVRLGPPALRNYPPSPQHLRYTQVLKSGGIDIDLIGIYLLLGVIVGTLIWLGVILQNRSQSIDSTPTPVTIVNQDQAQVFHTLTPVQPAPTNTATLTNEPTLTSVPTEVYIAPIPTTMPTLAIPTDTPVSINTRAPEIIYVYPPTNTPVPMPTDTATVEPLPYTFTPIVEPTTIPEVVQDTPTVHKDFPFGSGFGWIWSTYTPTPSQGCLSYKDCNR